MPKLEIIMKRPVRIALKGSFNYSIELKFRENNPFNSARHFFPFVCSSSPFSIRQCGSPTAQASCWMKLFLQLQSPNFECRHANFSFVVWLALCVTQSNLFAIAFQGFRWPRSPYAGIRVVVFWSDGGSASLDATRSGHAVKRQRCLVDGSSEPSTSMIALYLWFIDLLHSVWDVPEPKLAFSRFLLWFLKHNVCIHSHALSSFSQYVDAFVCSY